MVEKRFIFVIDNGEYTFYDLSENGEIMNMIDTEEMLNELNDECEFLKIENESLEDGATKYAELYHQSLKENEQLKQQIRDLYKFVKCDVDNEIDVYPKSFLGYLVNILKIIGDVE